MRRQGMLDWTEQGPAAVYDLHGQAVLEAVGNAERFLRVQAKARQGAVVRLITGRGRSGGGAPIRTRVRSVLRELQQRGDVVRDYLLEDSEGSFLVKLR
jgi:DNA-nicking Smr family endonuclease